MCYIYIIIYNIWWYKVLPFVITEIKRTVIFAPFQASVRKGKPCISKYILKKD